MARARTRRGGARRHLPRGWLLEHARAAREGWSHVRDNAAAAAVSVAVMAIAVALPALLFALLESQQSLLGEWGTEPTLSAFLTAPTGHDAAAALAARWRAEADIAGVELVTAEAAFAELAGAVGLGSMDGGGENPLPHVLVVTPRASAWADAGGEALAARLRSAPEVDTVLVDFAWVERLQALAALLSRALILLAAILVAGTVLIVGNTIRGLVVQQRAEIEVLKLVGATDAYVRRPFLYSGALHGLAAGCLALLLVEGVFLALAGPVRALAATYLSDFVLGAPGWRFAAAVIGVAAASGWGGAWLGTARSLRALEVGAEA